MPKPSSTNSRVQPWQIEARKKRGSAAQRRAAIAMFRPVEIWPAEQPQGSGAPPERPISLAGDASEPAAGGIPPPKENMMPKPNELKNGTTLSTEQGKTPAPPRPQPNVSTVDMRTKITVTELCGEIGKLPPASQPMTRWLGDFYAELIGCEKVTERPPEAPVWYGPYDKWLGRFRAFNLETGEWIASATLIVPGIANSFIDAAWKGAAINEFGRATANVMLGFRLGVTNQGAHVGSDGYRYVMRVIEPARYQRAAIDDFIDDAYGIERQPELPALEHDGGQDAAAEAAE